MHVLIIPSWYPTFPGDIGGSFFREQAHALKKAGCRAGVIFPQLRTLKKLKSLFAGPWGIQKEEDQGLPTYRWHTMNWFPRMVGLRAMQIIHQGLTLFDAYVKEQGRPDIIHAHSLLYAGGIAEIIKERYGIPFVVTEHSTAYASNLVSKKEKKMAGIWAGQANRCFAVSHEFSKFLTDYFFEYDIFWNELPNIVNESFFERKLSEKSKINGYRFSHVSLLEKKKGVDVLIKAFKRVSECYPDTSLIVGGDGPERKSLERLSNNLGLAAKVTFKGMLSREQVISVMENADSFVLPSRHETFGVVVIEAMALGKPVIATRCGGPESIIQSYNGLLVSVEDVDALADAMCHFVKNRKDYDAGKIRNACRAIYSEKAVTTRLKQAYQEILVVS